MFVKHFQWLDGRANLLSLVSASFRELGPPDLCHVVKSTGKSGQTDVRAASFFDAPLGS